MQQCDEKPYIDDGKKAKVAIKTYQINVYSDDIELKTSRFKGTQKICRYKKIAKEFNCNAMRCTLKELFVN